MNIAIVGGGQASLTLLDFFGSVENVTVVGIADLDSNAPGIIRAGQLGILTTKDMIALIGQPKVQMVAELTGVPKVRQMVLQALRPNQEIITAAGARLMCELIELQKKRNAEVIDQLSEQFDRLGKRFEGAIGQINASGGNIDRILRETQLIAMNGTIEAARAGKVGEAFGVVVARMAETLNEIRDTMDAITAAADESNKSLTELNEVEEHLKSVFACSAAD